MKIDQVYNKDSAVRWLKEKIDEEWTSAQIREMAALAAGIPIECKIILHKMLNVMEKVEFESWAHKKSVKCEDCGYRELMTIRLSKTEGKGIWTPETKCPKCLSDRFYPIVMVEKQHIFRQYWKKNPVLVTALILIIIAGLFLAGKSALPKARTEEKVVFTCLACGKYFVAPVSFYPVKCQFCTKRKALMAVKCKKCGEIFTWPKTNWDRQPPVCPKCKAKESTLLKKIPR